MATVSTFLKGAASQVGKFLGGQPVWIENKLDFSETNVSASDVVQALKLGAGAVVLRFATEVVTVEGGTATANIGDGNDADGYDAAVNFNSAGLVVGDGALVGGTKYTSADTIDIVPANDLDTAVIRVMAEVIYPEL